MSLAIVGHTLPATPARALEVLDGVQAKLMECPQVAIPTEHIIHGGMYARTVRLPKDAVIAGALIKLATVLIVNGHAMVFVGDGWSEVDGFNVIAASAGRKQLFVALGPVQLTMIFPTSVKTVEEAERLFTDEYEALQTRRDGLGTVTITGE